MDATRLVTCASNHPDEDRCFDLADVISVNTYSGWYDGELSEIPSRLEALVDHLVSLPQCHDKPILISEIGAGAIPGWRDWHANR